MSKPAAKASQRGKNERSMYFSFKVRVCASIDFPPWPRRDY